MYNRVLVPIDGSETSVRALHEAIRVGPCQKAAVLHLLYVVDTITNVPQSESPPSYIKEIYAQARTEPPASRQRGRERNATDTLPAAAGTERVNRFRFHAFAGW